MYPEERVSTDLPYEMIHSKTNQKFQTHFKTTVDLACSLPENRIYYAIGDTRQSQRLFDNPRRLLLEPGISLHPANVVNIMPSLMFLATTMEGSLLQSGLGHEGR